MIAMMAGLLAWVFTLAVKTAFGDHYVAVNPSQVKVTYNDSDKKLHAMMNATTDELKAAPEFKYSGRWSASKS